MGEKQKISLRLDEDLLKCLDSIIASGEGSTLTFKFDSLLNMNIKNYSKAIQSMIGRFSFLQVAYMCQAFNGTIFNYGIMPTKDLLTFQISEFYECGSMGFYTDKEFNVEELIKELNTLDDFQALFILNSIQEFWNSQMTDNRKNIEDLILIRKDDK